MTSDSKPNIATIGAINDETVTAYLREHPDFLARHSDVLTDLEAPNRWSGDGVVDMQRFMTDKLRGEIEHLRTVSNELIVTSRTNLSIQGRTHQAVLTLLSARGITEMARTIRDSLPLILDLDVVSLCLEPSAQSLPELSISEIRELGEDTVNRYLGDDHDIMLTHEAADDGTLFGEGAGLVRSAAIARLNGGSVVPSGILALGSRSHSTFHPGQGTELLTFLARVVEQRLHAWLEPGA